MPAPYTFGHSQEDERIEAEALALPGGRVLSVTSAGEMPLSLLAMGADEVTAIDVVPAQNHLMRLKLATALHLPRAEALAFLGYRRADPRWRAARLDALDAELPERTRAFCRSHRRALLRRGPIWAGRFETFLWRLLALTRPLVSRGFEELVAAPHLEAQEQVFARRFDRPSVHAIFGLAFHPRVYSGRGIDPRSLQFHDARRSLGEQFFGQFRHACTSTPARENTFLQLFTLRCTRGEAVPAYLTEAGVEALRQRVDRLRIVDGDLLSFLEASPGGAFDRFHLSNVVDWLDEEQFEALMRAIAKRAARPAWVVWRAMHVDRPVPEDVSGEIRIDRTLGRALRRRDRFPFYEILPARLGVNP